MTPDDPACNRASPPHRSAPDADVERGTATDATEPPAPPTASATVPPTAAAHRAARPSRLPRRRRPRDARPSTPSPTIVEPELGGRDPVRPMSSTSTRTSPSATTTNSSPSRSPTSSGGGPRSTRGVRHRRSNRSTAGVYAGYPERETISQGVASPTTAYDELQLFVAFYCNIGDFMAYDDGDDPDCQPADPARRRSSDRAVMGVVLAHEYGHAIQERIGALDRPLRDDRHRTAGRLLRRRLDRSGLPRRVAAAPPR